MKTKSHEEYEMELFNREIDYFPIDRYIKAKIPILHECLYGHTWLVAPDKILSGRGCPHCNGGIKKTNYKEELVTKGIKYTPIEDYVNWETPILHSCPNGHTWKGIPNNILKGQGCPNCAVYGFSQDKPAILYYIKIGMYYKIGITNRNIQARFKRDKDKPIEVLKVIEFNTGREAMDLEKRIFQEHPPLVVDGYLKSGGNTELFIVPIPIEDYVQCTSNSKI